MESSKVKNLIIIVLAILNLFMLAPVAWDAVGAQLARRREISAAAEVLAARGIAVSEDAELRGTRLDVCVVERDLEEEKRGADKVLGGVTVNNQGGNIISYTGERGQAVFRGSGGFEILFEPEAVPVGSDAEATARGIARDLGISLQTGRDTAEVKISDGNGSVRLFCQHNGARILGCSVTFTFANAHLMVVSGTRPLDSITADSQADTLDVPTVLMRALELMTGSGQVCSRLEEVEMCYTLSSTVSGTGILAPVWRIETDTGDFYINGLTGKQEKVG